MPNKVEKMFKVDLQLFNDGGAAGAEGTGAEATENAPKAEVKKSGSSRHKSGEFDNVVFGKQESTPSEEATSLEAGDTNPTGAGETQTPEDRRKAFNDLINGEYKDLYQENFQQVFDRRFKQVKGMESDLAAHKEVTDMLASRYGVDSIDEIKTALQEDTEYWESVAEERGMTVEQYHAMERLERENKEFRAFREQQAQQQAQQQAHQQALQQVDAWHKEAESVQKLYPNFNFKTEVQNPAFIQMLKSGVGVEHAYKVLHLDEITNDAARVAAQTADARAQAIIKQKASRPNENGTSSKSAVIVKNDVSKLTRKERAEIARRVARGEQIIF